MTEPTEFALALGLREELRERRFCDAVLHCHNDELVYTHRLVLAAISPLLARALAETDANEVDEFIHVSIPDVSADELSAFITHMHIGGFEEVQLAHNLMYLGVVEALAAADGVETHDNEFADTLLANTTSVVTDLSNLGDPMDADLDALAKDELDQSLNHIALRKSEQESIFNGGSKVKLTTSKRGTVEEREERILAERQMQMQIKKQKQQEKEKRVVEDVKHVVMASGAVCKEEPASEDSVVIINGDAATERQKVMEVGVEQLEEEGDKPLQEVTDNENVVCYVADGDENGLSPSKTAKLTTKRSPVWEYFLVLSKNSAKCKLCLATFSINNSTTTNLTRHLERKHKQEGLIVNSRIQEKKEMIREAEEETQRSTLVSVEEVNFAKVSPIWSHFVQLTISQVQCQHCDQVVKIVNSSTSAPLRHLRRQHPEIAANLYSQRDGNSMSPEKNGNAGSSILSSIWKFFERRSSLKSAVCTSCQLPIFMGENFDFDNLVHVKSENDDLGPVAHLVEHLRNTHVELYAAFESALKNQKSIRRRVRMFNASVARPKSALYGYFTFDDDKKSANCKACLQSVPVQGSKKGTVGLKKHLRAHHPRLYDQYLKDIGKEHHVLANRSKSQVGKQTSKTKADVGEGEERANGAENNDKNNNAAKRTCEHCGKVYATRKGLLVHVKAVHSGERPYSCNECGMRFARKESWRRHSHSTDRPYLCSICGKTFAKKHVRNVHERNHINGKRYYCDICNKTFSTNQRLQLHQRVHTGEKPFECHYSECGKRFAQKHHLITHIRTHTGEKPYECPTCHQMFKHLSTKAKHNCPGMAVPAEDTKVDLSQPIAVYEDEAHHATISIIRAP